MSRSLLPPALGAFLILMCLSFWPGLEQPGEAPRQALLLVSGPLLLLLASLGPVARPAVPFLVLSALPLLSGVLHIATASSAERLAVARDWGSLCSLALVGLCAALCPQRAAGESAADRWIERAAIGGLFLIGLLGVAQAWWGWQGLAQSSPPAATFMNRNLAAAMLVQLVPLACPALLTERWPAARWLSALAIGLGLALLVATRTRGAWIGALAGAGVGLLAWSTRTPRTRQRKTAATSAPAVVALLVVLAALFIPVRGPEALPPLTSQVSSFARPLEGTGAIRAALWRNSLAMIEDEPWLGHGAGRFAVAYPLYQQARGNTPLFGTERQPEHAESDFLEFAVELGSPASLALIALFAGAVVRSARQARRHPSRLAAARGAARAAAMGGMLVHSLVSFPLHHAPTAWLAWLLAGRAWSAPAAPARTLRPALRWSVAGLALLLLSAAAWTAARELQGRVQLAASLRAEERSSCREALEAAQRVVRTAPWLRRENGMAAMVHFACNREPQSSLAVLERALEMQPHQLNLLLAVGARRLKAGNTAAAEAAFSHALEVAPDLARAWLGMAMSRLAAGDHEGSQQACDRALALAPDLAPARAFCR